MSDLARRIAATWLAPNPSLTAKRVARHYLTVIGQEQGQGQQESQQGQGGQQEQQQQAPEGQDNSPNYGGKGPFNLPPEHVAAMQVPKGGACCAKCAFVDVENNACLEPNYITWNGGDPALPNLPLDEICSDWFMESEGPPAEDEQAQQAEQVPQQTQV